jgi:hypothetical protein
MRLSNHREEPDVATTAKRTRVARFCYGASLRATGRGNASVAGLEGQCRPRIHNSFAFRREESWRTPGTAKVNQVYDDEARQNLLAKINRVVENLEGEAETKASKTAADTGQSQESDESAGLKDEQEKMPWGVGTSH